MANIKGARNVITYLKDGYNIIRDSKGIANHVTSYFSNMVKEADATCDFYNFEDLISNLFNDHLNNILNAYPSINDIYSVVFALSSDRAPGSDDFGGFFYQTFREIVKHDFVHVILQFYNHGLITFDIFWPIALTNFKFKIMTKILMDRIASVLPHLISKEHKGVIKGRNICDCIL